MIGLRLHCADPCMGLQHGIRCWPLRQSGARGRDCCTQQGLQPPLAAAEPTEQAAGGACMPALVAVAAYWLRQRACADGALRQRQDDAPGCAQALASAASGSGILRAGARRPDVVWRRWPGAAGSPGQRSDSVLTWRLSTQPTTGHAQPGTCGAETNEEPPPPSANVIRIRSVLRSQPCAALGAMLSGCTHSQPEHACRHRQEWCG